MPEIDAPNIGNADEFSPVPIGKYLCKIDSIDDSKETKDGGEMWNLIHVVVDGPYEGKQIRDNISFSNETALKRVKLICSRAGLDVSKKFTLKPSMLVGKLVYVEVESLREYEDKKGKPRKAAQVGFAGYEMVDAETEARIRKGGKGDEPWANGKPKVGDQPSATDDSDPF
jgi:hypothetical protein